MNISETISQLATALSQSNHYEALQMRSDDHDIHFDKVEGNYANEKISSAKEILLARVPFVSWLINEPKIIPIPKTGIIGYLATLFGHKRFERICQKAQIDLKYRPDNFLCRHEIETFCLYAAEVFESDLKELLFEITCHSKTIRFLNEEESFTCRKNFENISCLNDCSNTHLKQLFSLLIPHTSFFKLFSQSAPHTKLTEIWHRVSLYEKMRLSKLSEYQWFMTVSKKIVDREISEGIVFRNGYSGFCKVHRIISENGAYKCFLKHIGKETQELKNIIAYRGTCPREKITFLEDLRDEFGSEGPKSTFEKTHRLLTDPEMGFIKHPKESVIAIGMSLGGCHLMRDSLLFREKLCRVITFAAPGPDQKSMQLFAKCINNKKPAEIEIEHWWEADDVVHYFGNTHLGAGCDPSKLKVSVNILELEDTPESESIHTTLNRIAQKTRFPPTLLEGATCLQAAFDGPHCRNTFEKPSYRVIHLNNQDHYELVDQLLNHDSALICDPKWEKMRQMAVITNDEPFVDYVERIHQAYWLS